MAANRKYFEKNEGFCDYCEKPLTKLGIKSYFRRYKIYDLVVCHACYCRAYCSGTLKYTKEVLTPEERAKRKKENLKKLKEYSKEYSKVKSNRQKIRTEYLKSLSPDELLDIVKNEEE